MKWVQLAIVAVAFLLGGINPAMSALIQFDFFFNNKSQSGSGMLEAIANKDVSFTAVNGFVRTIDYGNAELLWEFEKTYEKMSIEDVEKLEKFSVEEVKGSEYFKLFSDQKDHELSLSPSGFFNYDNLLFPTSTDLLLGNGGLLFMSEKGKELNLFTNGPLNYVDYQNDGFNIQTSFHLIAASGYSPSLPQAELPGLSEITAIPEPSSFALLSLGLVGFCFARRRIQA
ncbi:MAG: PEP-CTERM sorting domain-containing protein [Nitrosospira sp.]